MDVKTQRASEQADQHQGKGGGAEGIKHSVAIRCVRTPKFIDLMESKTAKFDILIKEPFGTVHLPKYPMHKKLKKTSLQLLLVTLFKMRVNLQILSKMVSTTNSRLVVSIKSKIFNLKLGYQVKSPFALEKIISRLKIQLLIATILHIFAGIGKTR